ncbi:MAG TPA: organomercurial lyase [Gemmatimonadales bacterium]|nr:organomercurial lyase [Gemmatimonadales bacterium]
MTTLAPLDLDNDVRLSVYRYFVRTGEAPSVRQTSDELAATPEAVMASLERLAAARVLVLHPTTRALWMAMPFSAVPTSFRVQALGRGWWANCAWDALGISAMLEAPSEIIPTCPDCGDPPRIRTTGRGLSHASGVVHFAVPAASWWDDIGFT